MVFRRGKKIYRFINQLWDKNSEAKLRSIYFARFIKDEMFTILEKLLDRHQNKRLTY